MDNVIEMKKDQIVLSASLSPEFHKEMRDVLQLTVNIIRREMDRMKEVNDPTKLRNFFGVKYSFIQTSIMSAVFKTLTGTFLASLSNDAKSDREFQRATVEHFIESFCKNEKDERNMNKTLEDFWEFLQGEKMI